MRTVIVLNVAGRLREPEEFRDGYAMPYLDPCFLKIALADMAMLFVSLFQGWVCVLSHSQSKEMHRHS